MPNHRFVKTTQLRQNKEKKNPTIRKTVSLSSFVAPKTLEKKSIEISKQISSQKKRECVVETNSKWLNSFALRSVRKIFDFLFSP